MTKEGTASAIDPRPRIRSVDGTVAVVGAKCTHCDYVTALETWRCPVCAGELVEVRFHSEGTVWSYTIVRIPYGDRVPPYMIAYVDLDDGPRLLARIAGDLPDPDAATLVGRRAVVVGVTENGDPEVEIES